MSNSSDYISRMVSETLGEESDSNLLPFHVPLSKGGAKARFDRRRGCITITFEGKHLEIPVGWGPFKGLNLVQTDFYFHIDRASDSALLLETIGPFFGSDITSLTLEGNAKGLSLKIEAWQGLQSAA